MLSHLHRLLGKCTDLSIDQVTICPILLLQNLDMTLVNLKHFSAILSDVELLALRFGTLNVF